MSNCYDNILGKKIKEDYKYNPISNKDSLSYADLKNIDISTIEDKGMFTLFKSNYLGDTFNAFKYKTQETLNENNKTSGIKVVEDIGSIGYAIKDKIASIKKIKSIDDIYIATHELTHLILNSNIHSDLKSKVFNEINSISSFLKERGILDIELEIKDKNNKNVNIKLSELSTIGSIDEYTREEIVTSFLSTLLANDFIKSNKRILAKIFSKENKPIVDLKGNIKGFKVISKNGKYVTTISQFYDILRDYGYYQNNNYIKKLAQYNYAIFNSSEEIKSMFFKEPSGVEIDNKNISIISNIENNLKTLKIATQKLHRNFFDNVGIADLLDLTKNSIMLKKALSLAKGGKTKMLEYAKTNKEYMQKLIEQIDYTERDEVDNILGHMSVFGFNILNNDIKPIDNILIKDTDKLFNDLKDINSIFFIKELEKNKNEFKNTLNIKLNKILNKIELTYDKEIRNKIENLISKSAKGNKTAYNELTKKINNLTKNYKNMLTSEETKLLTSKLVSLKAFIDNAENDYFDNIFKKFNSYYSKYYKEINKIYSIFNVSANKFSMFGENIELNFLENSKNLKITDDPTGIDKDNIIAKVNVNGKDYYAFVGDKFNTTIGNQDALVLPFNIEEFEKGIYEKNINGVNITFNAQNIKLKKDFIDKKLSTQFSRNSYIEAKKEVAKDLGYRQWKILRDNNILLTKDEVNNLIDKFPYMKDRFIQLPKDNPLVQISGSRWYIDSKISHQLLGTKGINIKNMYSAMLDEKKAKNLAIFTKSILDFTRELSKALLFISPRIQINNFMTSFATYVAHSNDMGALFPYYYKQAKKLYMEYKDTQQKLIIIDNQLKSEKNTNIISTLEEQKKKLEEKLNNNPLHYAFEHGFTDTLRTTALEINAVEDLTLYQYLKNKFGKNQANTLKAVMLNENNPLGKKLGEIFEHSELFPKLALYLERLKHLKNENDALIYTLNSFPTYNNLPLFLSIFDSISPYTKFFLNVPRMTAWAFVTHPKRFMSLYATTAMLPAVMDDDQQDSWYEENGYIDIGDFDDKDVYLSQASLDPILHPLTVLSYKPYIWDIPNWMIKMYHNSTGNTEQIMEFMLPINIGK